MASTARIDELKKKFDENPRRYFAPLANEFRKAGDIEQAIVICEEFLPQQPGHMSGHIVYGQALFEAGKLPDARSVFETALGLDPENLIALRHLGDIARDQGEHATAKSWYGRVLDADPRNDEIQALIARMQAEMDKAVVVEAEPAPTPRVSVPVAAPTVEMQPPVAPTVEMTPPPTPTSRATPAAMPTVEMTPPPAPTVEMTPVQSAPSQRIAEHDDTNPMGMPVVSAQASPNTLSDITDGFSLDGFETSPGSASLTPGSSVPAVGLQSTAFVAPEEKIKEVAGLDPVDDITDEFRAGILPLEVEEEPPTGRPEHESAPPPELPHAEVESAPPAAESALPEFELPATQVAEPEPEPVAGSSTAPAAEPEAAVEPALEHEAEAAPEVVEEAASELLVEAELEVVADTAPEIEPEAEQEAVAEPEQEPETEPQPEPEAQAEPEAVSAAEEKAPDASPAPARAPFVTETMAELYLAQGLREQALSVYVQLLANSPSDVRLQGVVASLTVEPVAVNAGPNVRDFFARMAARRPGERIAAASPPADDDFAAASEPDVPVADAPEVEAPIVDEHAADDVVDEAPPVDDVVAPAIERAAAAISTPSGSIDALFGNRAPGKSEDSAAAALAQAFSNDAGDMPVISGRPARAASGELSLDSVFRDGPARPPRASQSFSFDQFFSGAASSGEKPSIPEPRTSSEVPLPGDPPAERNADDIEQFNSWLQGLKQK